MSFPGCVDTVSPSKKDVYTDNFRFNMYTNTTAALPWAAEP